MPRLKVCGINDPAFAVAAAKLGVDYLGFVFAEGSPRRVAPERVREIMDAVRTCGCRRCPRYVGVFTDRDVSRICDIASEIGLDVVQLHSEYGAEDVSRIKELVFRPIISDIVAQGRFRQARTRREAHFSALNDEDEAWRNRNKQIGQDFADETLGFEVWRLALSEHGAETSGGGEGATDCVEDAVVLDGRVGTRCGGTGVLADWSRVAEFKSRGCRVILAGGISAANISAAIATGADVIDVNSSLETSPGVKSVRLLHELMVEMLKG